MSGGPGSRAWHVGRWGPLGWAETLVKLAAAVLAAAALTVAIGDDAPAPALGGARLAAVVILGLMALGLVVGIADRLMEREVVGIVFVPVMAAAHVAMAAALVIAPGGGGWLAAFAASMLLGEAVKLVFLRVSGFRVRDVPPAVVRGLTAGYAAGYAVLLVLSVAA